MRSIDIDLPNPLDVVNGGADAVAGVQDNIDRLAKALEILNPLNWPEMFTEAKNDSFRDLIEMMLRSDDEILTLDAYSSLITAFATLAMIVWVVELIYRLTMLSKGESGHGSAFIQSTVWLWALVPSLPAVLLGLQALAIVVGGFLVGEFVGDGTIEESLETIVSTEGLNPFVAGVLTFVQIVLILFIALELAATQIVLPIAALVLIVAVGLRWWGDVGDGLYRLSIFATLISLVAGIGMVVWFSFVYSISNLVFDNDPFARAMANVFALIAAAMLFWPIRRQYQTKIKPKFQKLPGNGEPKEDGGRPRSTADDGLSNEQANQRALQELQRIAAAPENTQGSVTLSEDRDHKRGSVLAERSLEPIMEETKNHRRKWEPSTEDSKHAVVEGEIVVRHTVAATTTSRHIPSDDQPSMQNPPKEGVKT